MPSKYACIKTVKHGDKDGNVTIYNAGKEYELTDSRYKELENNFEPVKEKKKVKDPDESGKSSDNKSSGNNKKEDGSGKK